MIKKLWKGFVYKMKLREMDRRWYYMGGSCYGLFPPSFYYTHSEDEIRKYTDEIIVELEKLLEEFAESSEAQINDSLITY